MERLKEKLEAVDFNPILTPKGQFWVAFKRLSDFGSRGPKKHGEQNTVNINSINLLDMQRTACNITCMARGQSGRIVIEIDPSVKLELYAALARSNSTLKDWFLLSAEEFCRAQAQPDLFRVEPSGPPGTQRREAYEGSFAGEHS